MAKKQQTERTPKGHEVPVPKRGEFMANLKKISKKPSQDDRSGKQDPQR